MYAVMLMAPTVVTRPTLSDELARVNRAQPEVKFPTVVICSCPTGRRGLSNNKLPVNPSEPLTRRSHTSDRPTSMSSVFNGLLADTRSKAPRIPDPQKGPSSLH